MTYLCNSQPDDSLHLAAMRQVGLQLETIPWKEPPRGSAAFYRDLFTNLGSRYPYAVDKDYDPRLRRRAIQLLQSGSLTSLYVTSSRWRAMP